MNEQINKKKKHIHLLRKDFAANRFLGLRESESDYSFLQYSQNSTDCLIESVTFVIDIKNG